MIFRHLSRSVASCDAPAMSSLVQIFKSWNQVVAGLPLLRLPSIFPCISLFSIGLYRDVWIAAIASSRKSLATRTAAICVRFHGRRVRHVYVTMQITFLARKSALIYRRGLRQRVASLTIDCNGVSAIRAYTVLPDDVAKEPHLPLRHTLPQHQNRPNLLQHPFIRFPLRP